MKINVLSAYQTTAEEFFNKILGWKATLVLDIRLKNTNQLSGFTKQEAVSYTHLKLLKAIFGAFSFFSSLWHSWDINL